MENELKGKRVAILVASGFERSELTEPLQALVAEGAEVDIISLLRRSDNRRPRLVRAEYQAQQLFAGDWRVRVFAQDSQRA